MQISCLCFHVQLIRLWTKHACVWAVRGGTCKLQHFVHKCLHHRHYCKVFTGNRKWPDKPIRIKWCEVSAEFKVSGGPRRWQSDPVTASCLSLNVGVFVLSRQISQRSGLSAGLETSNSTLNSTCLLRTNSSVSVNAFGSFRWWIAAQAESTSSWFRISWRLKSSDVHLRLLQQSREQVSSLRRSLDLKSVRI